MELDLDRVRQNAREATTEDLLDRVTVYRNALEPLALVLIEAELDQRGISLAAIAAHQATRQTELIFRDDGTVRPCSFCLRPASRIRLGWHRLWGRIPLFPRYHAYCQHCWEQWHAPVASESQ